MTYSFNMMKRSQILNNELTFENIKFYRWMDQVETKVFNKIQYYLMDLPDENYRINYENGMTTDEMSSIVLKNYDDMINFI